ncbi:MAG TPA: hypothetical protein VGB13_04590 [Candidatus Krumholzibacteria bacterium]
MQHWDAGTATATLAMIWRHFFLRPAERQLDCLSVWVTSLVLLASTASVFLPGRPVHYEPFVTWWGVGIVYVVCGVTWYLWYWRVGLAHRRLPTVWEAVLVWVLIPVAALGGLSARWYRDAHRGVE